MNANELANELEKGTHWIQDELARKWVVDMLRKQQAEIEAMRTRIEYMREKASLWEAEAHAGGFEAGVKSVTKVNHESEVLEILRKAQEK